jgi:hypothetical protein
MPRKPPTPKLTVIRPAPAPEHPTPSNKLGRTGLDLWRSVVESYEFSDPGSVQILYQACAAADRAEACREIIDTDGEIVKTRNATGESVAAGRTEQQSAVREIARQARPGS